MSFFKLTSAQHSGIPSAPALSVTSPELFPSGPSVITLLSEEQQPSPGQPVTSKPLAVPASNLKGSASLRLGVTSRHGPGRVYLEFLEVGTKLWQRIESRDMVPNREGTSEAAFGLRLGTGQVRVTFQASTYGATSRATVTAQWDSSCQRTEEAQQ